MRSATRRAPSTSLRVRSRGTGSAFCSSQRRRGIVVATARKKPFWKRSNPKAHHRKLTEAQRRRARELARRAGRRYPNLVDNARVVRTAKK